MSAPETKLTFTWYAWAKLKHACQKFDTEVSGFGITSLENPLLVEDFVTVKQECSAAYTEMDDVGIADFFDEQIEKGLQPVQFGRIWIHTHPSGINSPSGTDEATFEKVFGGCDWAIMFILTKSDVTYCALQFNKGPKARINIPVAVSYEQAYAEWTTELEKNVNKKTYSVNSSPYFNQQGSLYNSNSVDYGSYFCSQEYMKQSTPAVETEKKSEPVFGASSSKANTSYGKSYNYSNRDYGRDWNYGKRTYYQGKDGWMERRVPENVQEENKEKQQEKLKSVEQVVTEADDTNIWSDMYNGID